MESLLKKYDLPVDALSPVALVPSPGFRWDENRADVVRNSPFQLSMPTQTLNGSYEPSVRLIRSS
jgi:hypothetical protein